MQPQAETWTDSTGKFSIDAKFIGVEGQSIVLLKDNGTKISVPIARLSLDSRNQARKAYGQMTNQLKQPVTPTAASASAVAPTVNRTLDFEPPTPLPVDPMPAFPDNLSVRETIDFAKQQILAGHPEVLWYALPAEMRATFDDDRFRSEVSPFIDQSTALQSQVEPVVFKAIEVLVTKKPFVLGSPLLEQVPAEAMPQIENAYDPAVGVLYELVDFAFSMELTGDRTLTQAINYHGPRIGGHLKPLFQLVPPGIIDQFLDSLTIEQIDDDHAIVRVPQAEDAGPQNDFSFEFTSRETKLVRVSQRWVTEEQFEQWNELKTKLESGDLKQSMEQATQENAENMQGAAMMVGMFTGMANTVLDSLLAAESQEEFNQAIAQASAMANFGAGSDTDSSGPEMKLEFSGNDNIQFEISESMESSAGDSDSASVPSGPAPEGWTLDLTEVEIPSRPASGVAAGSPTTINKATIRDGILHLAHREGNDDLHEWIIFTFLDEGEKPDGKTFDINPNSGFSSPHVHFRNATAEGGLDSDVFMSEYAMKLEFGQATGGKLPGKIYLCLPDAKKSLLRGTFTATIEN
ncbi:hypothetical protein RMSM_07609 [Rhodopirellula maiorica SM1]|uniref:SLA1 homology domain-containing protein n=1 Tax=Rhodopirellula maiorica SM1 TaxID=1265738 RepID=M5RJB4_9BACT|nr:hypothetical protein RMSM_07609 [Rhodopirellula maiorica SM1]